MSDNGGASSTNRATTLVVVLSVALAAVRPGPHGGTGLAFTSDPSESEPALVEIPRLLGDGSRLAGEYVSVTSRVFNPDSLPTASSDGAAEFIFEPVTDYALRCDLDPNACSQFDNVNVYVQIDRFASDFWVDRLGVDIDFSVTAVTHSTSTSRAHDSLIAIGSGGLFLRNNAHEDDIILHEYAHVVLGKLGFRTDTTSTVEQRALGEGYADYFALSYLGHPEFAGWATRCPPRYECIGPPDDTEVRTLATDPSVWNWNYGKPDPALQYGVCTRKHLGDMKCKISWSTYEDTYRWAMIWGATLWDVRTELGATLADKLIVSAIEASNDEIKTLEDGANAILVADLQVHGGTHVATLSAIFAARGIPHTVVGVEEADAFVAEGDFDLAIFPNPSATAFTASFDLPSQGPTTIRLLDLAGREVHRDDRGSLAAGRHEIAVAPRHLAGGLYILRVEQANASASVMIARR